MSYIQILFYLKNNEEYISDILSAQLADLGFESFVNTVDGLEAYIKKQIFSKEHLDTLVKDFEYSELSYKIIEVEDKNWNEEWEKHYFEPILIDNKCVIHSSFHQNVPQAEYDIIINPKMAFGTGHHETTSLMISKILQADLRGKTVLDMGCGTSVLAIFAKMRGASNLTAIDIDDWCVENSLENIRLNKIDGIEVLLGGAELLSGRHFDVIFANINRNILLADMAEYIACLPPNGELYMSGFYSEDIPVIKEKALSLGMKFVDFQEKNNWTVVRLIKN
jgi:Ribosomal protein L11 methylase